MEDLPRGGGILDGVRAACATVAVEAAHVRIDTACIPGYAAALTLDTLAAAELDPRHHFLGAPEDTAAFVLTLDAINFGSGYFPHLRKRPGLSGYFTLAAALTDRFRARGPFTASELRALTADDCRLLFGQAPDGGPIDELTAFFAGALNDLGRDLLERFDGRPAALVEAAGRSAARLVKMLAALPTFRDVATYRGRAVPFYKRAQLVAADLALALGGAGLGAFDGLDRLTIFADNLMPHMLRVDGVLRYDDALAAHVAAGELLTAGSPVEVEIRAAAVHAAELLVAACRDAGRGRPRAGSDRHRSGARLPALESRAGTAVPRATPPPRPHRLVLTRVLPAPGTLRAAGVSPRDARGGIIALRKGGDGGERRGLPRRAAVLRLPRGQPGGAGARPAIPGRRRAGDRSPRGRARRRPGANDQLQRGLQARARDRRGPPRRLIETVAEEIAAALLAEFAAEAVTVTVRKPEVALKGAFLGAAGVRIRRAKGEG